MNTMGVNTQGVEDFAGSGEFFRCVFLKEGGKLSLPMSRNCFLTNIQLSTSYFDVTSKANIEHILLEVSIMDL